MKIHAAIDLTFIEPVQPALLFNVLGLVKFAIVGDTSRKLIFGKELLRYAFTK